jgi:hypothetical protein
MRVFGEPSGKHGACRAGPDNDEIRFAHEACLSRNLL